MEQVRSFDTAKGGAVKNFCLANVCKGYSIPNYYASAWEAWQHTQQHTDQPPAGLDVPVFFSYTATIDGITKNWGHIGVRLRDGRFWSDGTIYPSIAAYERGHYPRYVGWGESINNVTILKGGNMPTLTNDGDVVNLYRKAFDRDPEQGAVPVWTNRDWKDVFYGIFNSGEWQARNDQRLAQKAFYDKYVNTIKELESRPTKAQLDELLTKLDAEAKKVEQAEAKAKALEQDKAESVAVGNSFIQWIGSLFKKG